MLRRVVHPSGHPIVEVVDRDEARLIGRLCVINVRNGEIRRPCGSLPGPVSLLDIPPAPPDSRTVPEMGFMLPDIPRKDTGGERWVCNPNIKQA